MEEMWKQVSQNKNYFLPVNFVENTVVVPALQVLKQSMSIKQLM